MVKRLWIRALTVAIIAIAGPLAWSGAATAEVVVSPRQGKVLPDLTPSRIMAPTRVGEDLAREMRCLAQNIYFEARSEALIGQIAVAMVTLNRVASKRFPDSICGVVKQGGNGKRNRCQFSWYCDGKADRTGNVNAWQRAQYIAYRAMFQLVADPTRGAMWYHADYVKPGWAKRLRKTGRIGRHVYYGES